METKDEMQQGKELRGKAGGMAGEEGRQGEEKVGEDRAWEEKWEGAKERARAWLAGEMSREERVAYGRWLDGDMQGREALREEARTWRRVKWAWAWERLDEVGAGERMMERVHARWRRMWWTRGVAAAVVLLAVGVGAWWWSGVEQGQEKKVRQLAIVPLAGEAVPVLRLADGREVALYAGDTAVARLTAMAGAKLLDSTGLVYGGEGMRGEQAEAGGVSREKEGVGERDGEGVDVGDEGMQGEEEWQELRVPRGCEFNVTLADGSRVWLNAGSVLRFPGVFEGRERRVELVGEGYFEVVHDEVKGFVVETEGASMRVLGTSFAVRAYSWDEWVTTTVVEGRVATGGVGEEVVLTGGWQARVERATGQVTEREVDVRRTLAWREGRIVMEDARLEDIFRELALWYDFETVYAEPGLKDVRFYLHTNRYAEIDGILEHLERTRGVHFTVAGRTIYVSDGRM